jgi:tetratricopeptide (TPR) repeat protein
MAYDQTQLVQTTKRLLAAEGYLELRMPGQALESLETIDDPGPFRGAIELLRGKALWLAHRYDEAATALEYAAKSLRAPLNREAWLALSIYYRNQGQSDEALESLARARGAHPPKPRPEVRPT